MITPLPFIQLAYAIVSLYSGLYFWIKNPKYLANQLNGTAYLLYCIPGFLLSLSHLIKTPEFITLSTKSMIVCSCFGIGLLFLGTRVYFKGSMIITKKLVIPIFLGALIIGLTTIFLPNSFEIISLEPLNSKMSPIIGLMLFVWHNYFCLLSIYHLYQIRKEATNQSNMKKGTEDNEIVIKKLNYLISGFIFSILGLLLYSFANDSSIADNIFFSLILTDLICIWRGLTLK